MLDTILALDVGTTESGYVLMSVDNNKLALFEFGKIENEKLLQVVKTASYDHFVFEQFQCYGMPVGESTITSIMWNGRFIQAAADKGRPITPIFRKDEKMALCHTMKAKDANIRQALIDRFAKTENGKGTKKDPDVFYGVSKDVWQAIAVGVTFADNYLSTAG